MRWERPGEDFIRQLVSDSRGPLKSFFVDPVAGGPDLFVDVELAFIRFVLNKRIVWRKIALDNSIKL